MIKSLKHRMEYIMENKLTRAKIESNNKASVMETLKTLLENEYGAVYEVADGYAVPIGKSPLDGAMMWVTVGAKAKTIQSHNWGKGIREYYNGYEEAEAYRIEKEEKAEKAEKRKELAKAKAERDKKAREKRKTEKEKKGD